MGEYLFSEKNKRFTWLLIVFAFIALAGFTGLLFVEDAKVERYIMYLGGILTSLVLLLKMELRSIESRESQYRIEQKVSAVSNQVSVQSGETIRLTAEEVRKAAELIPAKELRTALKELLPDLCDELTEHTARLATDTIMKTLRERGIVK